MNISIHRVVSIRTVKTDNLELSDGHKYSSMKIYIEDEKGHVTSIDLFSYNSVFPDMIPL